MQQKGSYLNIYCAFAAILLRFCKRAAKGKLICIECILAALLQKRNNQDVRLRPVFAQNNFPVLTHQNPHSSPSIQSNLPLSFSPLSPWLAHHPFPALSSSRLLQPDHNKPDSLTFLHKQQATTSTCNRTSLLLSASLAFSPLYAATVRWILNIYLMASLNRKCSLVIGRATAMVAVVLVHGMEIEGLVRRPHLIEATARHTSIILTRRFNYGID
ncbi:hypothetical protein M5K25_022785 [Dendrobium thyrsiflorum]|uniref:Uncharacterized protein n=1 Tax=Dendrobium thyrsiflorum TaxID=117978 RepID=A0ABD0U6R7_DENTH